LNINTKQMEKVYWIGIGSASEIQRKRHHY